MPACPHDTDDTGPTEPDDPVSPTPDEPSSRHEGNVDPAEVDARWAQIVADLRGAPDPRAWEPDPEAEEAEEHFVPPDPGPVLGGDPLLTIAWSLVVGVPGLLVLAVIVWRSIPGIVLQVSFVAFLASVAVLVWRMPHDRDDDSGPGAVV